jgi:hypothetical protein
MSSFTIRYSYFVSSGRCHRGSASLAYRGVAIAVGTRHGKQHQFAPAFADVLGARLVTPPDLDTDRLGTFSGERPRVMTALQAAREKARMAMAATGLPLGLASEASYGPLPDSGVTGHEEILLFCDTASGIEVLEGHRAATVPGSTHRVARDADLPPAVLDDLSRQAVIVRPDGRPGGVVTGITGTHALRAAIAAAAASAESGLALVEPDLRAHHNPARRRVLRRLARTLAHRLDTPCPACRCPGFGRMDTEAGLPCAMCGEPTASPLAVIHGCPACGHTLRRAVPFGHADPRDCPDCNP